MNSHEPLFCLASRKTRSSASCFIFRAHASGVAHDSASGSSAGAPRAMSNWASSLLPQRQAQPRGVDFNMSSRRSSLAP